MPDLYIPNPEYADPLTLPANGEVNVVAAYLTVLRVKEGAGATATVTEINQRGADEHGDDDVTTTATSADGHPVTWPLYKVTVSGGACTVGGV